MLSDSRYFEISDMPMMHFDWYGLHWDFVSLRWWSRMYEYQWVFNLCRERYREIGKYRVVDIGTGGSHPGVFILKSVGFGQVTGTDMIPEDEWRFGSFMEDGLRYRQSDICVERIGEFDLVVCISMLEHLEPGLQEVALRNMLGQVASGGGLALTFDVPGYDYATDLVMYKDVIRSEGFQFFEVENTQPLVTTLRNRVFAPEELQDKNMQCYRLFAWRF